MIMMIMWGVIMMICVLYLNTSSTRKTRNWLKIYESSVEQRRRKVCIDTSWARTKIRKRQNRSTVWCFMWKVNLGRHQRHYCTLKLILMLFQHFCCRIEFKSNPLSPFSWSTVYNRYSAVRVSIFKLLITNDTMKK